MLSYQHIYHAGSLPDVHKHAVLAEILKLMVKNPEPMSYFETHAGRGIYDLTTKEAEKTGEAKAGVTNLLQKNLLPDAHPLMAVIADTRMNHGRQSYPGSPAIAQSLLRPRDFLMLMELHPQEYLALNAAIRGKNVNVQKRDGLRAIIDLSPLNPDRGMVLIDPSFEVKTEYMQVADAIVQLHQQWPQAVILMWYPLLDAKNHEPMVTKIEGANLPGFWKQEIIVAPSEKSRMRGSGVIAINMPQELKTILAKIPGWLKPAPVKSTPTLTLKNRPAPRPKGRGASQSRDRNVPTVKDRGIPRDGESTKPRSRKPERP